LPFRRPSADAVCGRRISESSAQQALGRSSNLLVGSPETTCPGLLAVVSAGIFILVGFVIAFRLPVVPTRAPWIEQMKFDAEA
jgi:hypothetical protein